MFTKSVLICAALGVAVLPLSAQVTEITAQYFDDYAFAGPPSNPLMDETGTALTAGTAAAGDGAIFQVGYFAGMGPGTDPMTFGDSEWSTFTPLTSNGGRHVTTIGDSGGVTGDIGIFQIYVQFDPAVDAELPPGYPALLGIRFYNSTDMSTATYYNTVTTESWLLAAPTVPAPIPTFLELDSPTATFAWQSGASGQYQTSLLMTIPEPSTTMLVMLGALTGLARRRRQ